MRLNLILLGVQGAGKGVQADWLRRQYGIPHVSTGALFRSMRDREDDLAQRIQALMSAGTLISDGITNEVVRERLERPDAAAGVILDGYPRNIDQAAWLAEHLAQEGTAVSAVLLFELDLYTAFRRAFGRISSANGERLYNLFGGDDGIEWQLEQHPQRAWPPRVRGIECASGEPLLRRPDDASAFAVIRRIDTYLQTTTPLIAWYQERGLLRRIDAAQDIPRVSKSIAAVLDQVSARARDGHPLQI